MGHLYASQMERANGAHALVFDPTRATGKCLSLISGRDAERTMLTDLGAAIRLPSLPEPFEDALRNAQIAHFTGYELLDPVMQSLVLRAMAIAREAGARVSFDAADPFVVTGNRDLMWEVLTHWVDVAFLNADEARGLTSEDPADAAARIAERAQIGLIVVKMGSRGSLLWHDGRIERVAAQRVAAVDTTGAGDSFAGGFLYGLALGWEPERCARLGAAVAALTVAQVGATVKDADRIAAALASVSA
jgi:sugar/nucleoside kinase (ribokinase family)